MNLFSLYENYYKFEHIKPTILIIGLGDISIGYDFNSDSNCFRSHAYSINEFSKRLTLGCTLYGVDPDKIKIDRAKESKLFCDENLYRNIEDLPRIVFDLILICTPIFTLNSVLLQVFKGLSFKKIFVEKPGAATFDECNSFDQLSIDHAGAIVGYPRRSLPFVQKLRILLKDYSEYGWKVRIRFSGDPLNILSHFVDLTEFLLGDVVILESKKIDGLYVFSGSGLNNPNVSVSVIQTGLSNISDHQVELIGPINCTYSEKNKTFICADPKFTDEVSSLPTFEYQLTNMIGFESLEYLDWMISGPESNLSSRISFGYRSLLKVLEESDYGK